MIVRDEDNADLSGSTQNWTRLSGQTASLLEESKEFRNPGNTMDPNLAVETQACLYTVRSAVETGTPRNVTRRIWTETMRMPSLWGRSSKEGRNKNLFSLLSV
eukprot:Gregarina_sp_Pseudo_9__2063@NODE_2430_length_998_cov_3_904067_g2236_i0_p1_GENE_NODE_2430_length_998_cov_3_904067_g2236_i0NODE_2430_length_998_cov_3_904067_g2236_i0_p1_ORF_typecomplete_len103_score6_83_NODE_2430_length_998_cov_3_904067_g2236_i0305613